VKLYYSQIKMQQMIDGTLAMVLRNDVAGSSLIIQSGTNRLEIKLADLINFIAAQEAEEKTAKPDVTT
jgi:hypothetical protein